LLRHRDNQGIEYSVAAMEAALARHFGIVTKATLESRTRILYHAKAARSEDPVNTAALE
jgi:hypothetical protein